MIACLEGHFSSITCLEFVNNNSYLLSSSRDNVVIVWNLNQFQSIKTIPIYEVSNFSTSRLSILIKLFNIFQVN